jgi:hypothetical protein
MASLDPRLGAPATRRARRQRPLPTRTNRIDLSERPDGRPGGDGRQAGEEAPGEADRADSDLLRKLLVAGGLPESWIPSAHSSSYSPLARRLKLSDGQHVEVRAGSCTFDIAGSWTRRDGGGVSSERERQERSLRQREHR